MGLNEKEPLKVSHHPVKFGGHWHCGSGDTMVLVCHVILQDHVTKGSNNYMGRSPLSRAYSNSLLRAIVARNHLPFFKIFSNFVHFCPNFQIFNPFLPLFNIFFLKKRQKLTEHTKNFYQSVQKRCKEKERQLQSFLRNTQTQKVSLWKMKILLNGISLKKILPN